MKYKQLTFVSTVISVAAIAVTSASADAPSRERELTCSDGTIFIGEQVRGPKTAPHCITPTGVDLNERYGVSETIIAPFCANLNSGRPWTVSNSWFMSPTFTAMPAGFEPTGETPIEDFIAKLVGVKYVVDPGTTKEKTYMFGNDDDLGIFDDGVTVVANLVSLGSLKPLSVGDHVVDSYLLFSAMHCDGFGDVVADNCLPAGETLFSSIEFEVTPRQN